MIQTRVSALLALLFLAGCATTNVGTRISQPITVHALECDDPTLGKMITRSVLEWLKDGCKSEVLLDNHVQTGLVIKGIVYRKDINSGGGTALGTMSVTNTLGLGAASSRSNTFAGQIVEGISLVASVDGKEVESATYFQRVQKGEYESPQEVAENAVDQLIEKLEQRGLIVRR